MVCVVEVPINLILILILNHNNYNLFIFKNFMISLDGHSIIRMTDVSFGPSFGRLFLLDLKSFHLTLSCLHTFIQQ